MLIFLNSLFLIRYKNNLTLVSMPLKSIIYIYIYNIYIYIYIYIYIIYKHFHALRLRNHVHCTSYQHFFCVIVSEKLHAFIYLFFSLFCFLRMGIIFKSLQALPLRVRVDVGVLAKKGLFHIPQIFASYRQMHFCAICVWGRGSKTSAGDTVSVF